MLNTFKIGRLRHFLSMIFFIIIIFVSEYSFATNNGPKEIVGISSLMSAVASNDIEGVKFFIKVGTSIINQKNIGGATALHIAAREGNLEIVEILVNSGAKVNISDNEGWTALMRASLIGNSQMISLLLENEADASKYNKFGESALLHSSFSNCNSCVKSLLSGYNFVKKMQYRDLKYQITQSYDIARNRDNKEMQNLFEIYLDELISFNKKPVTNHKAFKLISKDQSNDENDLDIKKESKIKAIQLEAIDKKSDINQKQSFKSKKYPKQDRNFSKKIYIVKSPDSSDDDFKEYDGEEAIEVEKEFIKKENKKIFKLKKGQVENKQDKANNKEKFGDNNFTDDFIEYSSEDDDFIKVEKIDLKKYKAKANKGFKFIKGPSAKENKKVSVKSKSETKIKKYKLKF